jgi:hypothetical protein
MRYYALKYFIGKVTITNFIDDYFDELCKTHALIVSPIILNKS